MDVFVSRYGHRENIWDIGCIFLPNMRCLVFRNETKHSFFSHISAYLSIFWMPDCLNIVPLASLKSSSAKREAICIEALSLFSPPSCSCLVPALLRAALPLLPQHKQAWMANIHHCHARCWTSQAGMDWTGWGDGLPNSTKNGMLWGKTPLLWELCRCCFTWIHICSLRMCNK